MGGFWLLVHLCPPPLVACPAYRYSQVRDPACGLCICFGCRAWAQQVPYTHMGTRAAGWCTARQWDECSLLVELLYNASGQYSWLMVVSGHCVLDVRLSSVIVCWLMAIWMNVVHAVVAHWLFFFAGPLPYHVHDSALVSLWGCWQSVCFG